MTATKSNKLANRDYTRLRINLMQRGLNLRRFALLHGYSVPTVYTAAAGTRRGLVAIKIRKHLEELTR